VNTLPSFADIEVSASLQPTNLVWTGDESHIKQILLNLLGNSASAKATQIQIMAEKQSDQFIIDVIDNGKGIPESEAPFIFERYYRGDSKRKKKHGLGLGLTISRLLAKAHHGNVELVRSSEAGTVFRLTLSNSPPPKTFRENRTACTTQSFPKERSRDQGEKEVCLSHAKLE